MLFEAGVKLIVAIVFKSLCCIDSKNYRSAKPTLWAFSQEEKQVYICPSQAFWSRFFRVGLPG